MSFQANFSASGRLNKFESAYRSGYSTETALLRIVNDTRRAADDGALTALVALDISAAFDAADHTILCDRLRDEFGVDGVALRWLESFVGDRSQYVAVSGERSSVTSCKSGVPQGSILFLIQTAAVLCIRIAG